MIFSWTENQKTGKVMEIVVVGYTVIDISSWFNDYSLVAMLQLSETKFVS